MSKTFTIDETLPQPQGWRLVTLGEISRFSKGIGITKNEVIPEGVPCIRYGELYTRHNFIISFIKDVLFVDASRDYQPGKNKNALLDEHIEKILETCKARKDVEKYAHVAAINEIADNDFNLNIPRYVDTFEEEEEIDIDAVQREIDQLEKELSKVRAEMVEKTKEIQR